MTPPRQDHLERFANKLSATTYVVTCVVMFIPVMLVAGVVHATRDLIDMTAELNSAVRV